MVAERREQRHASGPRHLLASKVDPSLKRTAIPLKKRHAEARTEDWRAGFMVSDARHANRRDDAAPRTYRCDDTDASRFRP